MVGENFFPDSVDSTTVKPAPLISMPPEAITLQPPPQRRQPSGEQEECCSQG